MYFSLVVLAVVSFLMWLGFAKLTGRTYLPKVQATGRFWSVLALAAAGGMLWWFWEDLTADRADWYIFAIIILVVVGSGAFFTKNRKVVGYTTAILVLGIITVEFWDWGKDDLSIGSSAAYAAEVATDFDALTHQQALARTPARDCNEDAEANPFTMYVVTTNCTARFSGVVDTSDVWVVLDEEMQPVVGNVFRDLLQIVPVVEGQHTQAFTLRESFDKDVVYVYLLRAGDDPSLARRMAIESLGNRT